MPPIEIHIGLLDLHLFANMVDSFYGDIKCLCSLLLLINCSKVRRSIELVSASSLTFVLTMAHTNHDIVDPAVKCHVCLLYVRESQLWWHQRGFMHSVNAGLAYLRANWISRPRPGDDLDSTSGV